MLALRGNPQLLPSRLASILWVAYLGACSGAPTEGADFAHRCALFDGKWRCFELYDGRITHGPMEPYTSVACYRDQPPSRDDRSPLDWEGAVDYAANSLQQCMVGEDGVLQCDTGDPRLDHEHAFPDNGGFVAIDLFDDRGYSHPESQADYAYPLWAVREDGGVERAVGYYEHWHLYEGNFVEVQDASMWFYTLDEQGTLERTPWLEEEAVLAQAVDAFAISELISRETQWTIPWFYEYDDCYEAYVLSLSQGELTIHEPLGYCAEGLEDDDINFAEMVRVFTEEAPTGGGYVAVYGGIGGACVLDDRGQATCWGLQPGDCRDEECDRFIESPPSGSRWRFIHPEGIGITRSGRAAIWTSDEVWQLPRCD